ncbi:MAG: hypothetical protein RLZZ156_324 [Deinococcota bacterium]
MKRILILVSSLALLISSFVLAQSLTGTWTLRTPEGQTITLTLQDSNGQIMGKLSNGTSVYALQGNSSGSQAEGLYEGSGEEGFFSLTVEGNTLNFIFGGLDANGQADTSTAQQVVFTRATTNKPLSTTTKPPVTAPNTSSNIIRSPIVAKLPTGTTAKAGAKYTAGTRVNLVNHGVSFVTPKGFSGQTAVTTNGNVTFFSQGKTANIFIWAFTGLEPKDASAWLEYALELDTNLKLEPLGTPKVVNGVLSARHTHPQLESQTSLVFSQSSAIGFTVITSKATQNQLEGISKSLTSSAKFAPSLLADTVKRLKLGLNGRYLLHYSFTGAGSGNVGGTENKRQWDLCSNGQYAYTGRVESSYSSNNYWAGTNTSFFSTNGADQVGFWRVFAINDVFSILTISSQGALNLHLLSNIQGAGGKLPFLDGKELGAYGKSSRCS